MARATAGFGVVRPRNIELAAAQRGVGRYLRSTGRARERPGLLHKHTQPVASNARSLRFSVLVGCSAACCCYGRHVRRVVIPWSVPAGRNRSVKRMDPECPRGRRPADPADIYFDGFLRGAFSMSTAVASLPFMRAICEAVILLWVMTSGSAPASNSARADSVEPCSAA